MKRQIVDHAIGVIAVLLYLLAPAAWLAAGIFLLYAELSKTMPHSEHGLRAAFIAMGSLFVFGAVFMLTLPIVALIRPSR